MPLRFRAQSQAVAVAGLTIAHGLAVIPDEWSFNYRNAPAGGGLLYMYAQPTSTSFFIAAATAAASADVFVSVSHSLIE
jgi:hypothetical protein